MISCYRINDNNLFWSRIFIVIIKTMVLCPTFSVSAKIQIFFRDKKKINLDDFKSNAQVT